ncbi:MAG: N-acetylmuramoyl-L-alanine amidase [Bacteroidales bacterium]|jgi:N-acetylmuramoyl-L-alanine amidase|nr:N-acetylmuramoyl-L-alanine amidase [Bacteroidales bacterium]
MVLIFPVAAQESSEVLRTVVIDAGHGGKDPGAVGLHSKEKNIVLSIALQVGNLIQQKYPEVKVIYTRDKDVFVDLAKRGDIANKAQANLFISIHANANAKKTAAGAETYVMGNSKTEENMAVAKLENSVILIEDDYTERYAGFDNSAESYIYFSLLQNAYLHQSLSVAAEMQEQLTTTAKRIDRGVRQANFVVLWKTSMPSVLVEVGFISNEEEENYISSKEGKSELASSIFNAFCAYKSKIDERNVTKSATIPEKEGKIPEKPEEKQATDTATHKVSPHVTDIPAGKVEFCVQIATSARPMDTSPSNFKKYKGVECIQSSPNFYKYIVGRTVSYDEAQATCKKVRNDFKDAFVMGIINGKLVQASEAVKKINGGKEK